MSLRALLILAVAAVVLAALAFVGQDRSSSSLTDAQAALFPELANALNDVERVRLAKAGDEVIATLEGSDAGWSVAERDGYPADVAKIRRALLDLAEARRVERMTANPDYYGRLGVEPIESEAAGGTLVAIETAANEFPALIVGDAESSSYRYGRFADESESFLFDRNPELPRETADWLDAQILDVDGSRVREVTITHPDGETLRIHKDDPEQANFTVADVPPERELMHPGVANVTGGALADLALEDVAAAESGPPSQDAQADDAVTARYRTFDGLVVTARGVERDGAGWLTFEAAVDPEPAEAASAADTGDAADGEAGGGAGDPASEANASEAATSDVRAQAEAINATVSGWRYRIASHQYEQITRRMADLLQEADAQGEEQGEE